jgi:hypothetical protein
MATGIRVILAEDVAPGNQATPSVRALAHDNR